MARPQYDAIVVGAGPYGLSTAAHLLGRGLDVAVFGKPLELWRNHMPKGMRLRSHWWASNLADPAAEFSFDRFFQRSSKYEKCYPEPVDAFIDYASWFQQRVVPRIDPTYVSNIETTNHEFVVTLADGRQAQSAAVVMAVGLIYFAYWPFEFHGLPAGSVSHSSAHNDLSHFQGKRVLVVGGGQSALESSALLHESGATVHNVSRRPIDWLAPDREGQRRIIERIAAPRSGIAPGWINWFLEHMPYAFNRLPQEKKDRWIRPYLSAGVSAWVKDRVIGNVTLHEARQVIRTRTKDGGIEATLSDGTGLVVDHIILATGYHVDIQRLTMIDAALRAEITTHRRAPVLNPHFESTVPGLYFVGLSSLPSFGPLYRFVAGCRATAPRVAADIAKRKRRNNPVALRTRMKHAIAWSASLTGIDALVRGHAHDVPFTASYHRVVERLDTNHPFALPAMQITTKMLERHLDWIARNFHVVALEDLGSNGNGADPRPLATITFDDGYRDIYDYAFPLLKRKGIPAGIFVVTDLVGTEKPPMHERVHALLAEAERRQLLTAKTLMNILRDANTEAPEPVHRYVDDPFTMTRVLLQTLPYADLQRVIERLQMDFPLQDHWSEDLQPLSWDMLTEMRKAGMTIGSHSKTHAFLANESEECVREEAESSRLELQRRLGIAADWFAYPGGSFNSRVVRAVARAGYRYAFTDCHHRDREHPWLTLPRKTMWERSCLDPSGRFSPAIMSCHAAGIFERFSGCTGAH